MQPITEVSALFPAVNRNDTVQTFSRYVPVPDFRRSLCRRAGAFFRVALAAAVSRHSDGLRIAPQPFQIVEVAFLPVKNVDNHVFRID